MTRSILVLALAGIVSAGAWFFLIATPAPERIEACEMMVRSDALSADRLSDCAEDDAVYSQGVDATAGDITSVFRARLNDRIAHTRDLASALDRQAFTPLTQVAFLEAYRPFETELDTNLPQLMRLKATSLSMIPNDTGDGGSLFLHDEDGESSMPLDITAVAYSDDLALIGLDCLGILPVDQGCSGEVFLRARPGVLGTEVEVLGVILSDITPRQAEAILAAEIAPPFQRGDEAALLRSYRAYIGLFASGS